MVVCVEKAHVEHHGRSGRTGGDGPGRRDERGRLDVSKQKDGGECQIRDGRRCHPGATIEKNGGICV